MASSTLPAFTMAFQPIVDADQRAVFAYEALVRGLEGEGAPEVLGRVGAQQRFAFHEACRMRAIELAARLGMRAKLSLNVMPNDVAGQEQCFRSAMAAASRCGFPVKQLMFELTEGERVRNLPGLAASFKTFKCCGFTSAIDDFGAAYAGFELLAAFQPDIVKVDMGLVRGVHADPVRLAIVRGVARSCGELGVRVVAEGIETRAELRALRAIGVQLFQGYLFSRPVIATLPPIAWDAT
jgi:EAL domain-containing protein (putative c-di-GMP-specific phosphodiesterase class I)